MIRIYFISIFGILLMGCTSNKNCKNALCTDIFVSINVNLKDSTNTKMLGISTQTVLASNNNIIHTQNEPNSFNPEQFSVLDDRDLKDIGFNKSATLELIIFKDKKLIKAVQFKVKTDCCHIGKVDGPEEIVLN